MPTRADLTLVVEFIQGTVPCSCEIRPPALPTKNGRDTPDWRLYTRKYRRKKRWVRDPWLVSASITLCVPIGAIPVLVLGTSFVSFMILDEIG